MEKIICDKCKGTGIGKSNFYACTKCWGAKKLDWVENVVGKKPPREGFNAINLTHKDIMIQDLGVILPAGSNTDLSIIQPIHIILKSDDLKHFINEYKITIIDKTRYLDERY